jgi:glycosyltransferase involved in cell wall biosynthesis
MTEDHQHLALCVFNLSGQGGEPRRMTTLANAFAARGRQVDLVAVRSQDAPRHRLSPLTRLVTLDPWWTRVPAVSTGRWALATIPALANYLRRERPAVLLSSTHLVNVAAPWARSLARVPTKLVLRIITQLSLPTLNARARFRLWQARLFYARADAIITNSNGLADDVARVAGVPRESITTIYDPVLTPDVHDKIGAALDHPWFTPGSPPVLLAVGRFTLQKDLPTLFKALARVRTVRPARLIVLGEGKERAKLEGLASELGVAADISLPGFVANPFPYMARASVFVLSSAWEGLPGVLIEAMACGCPVVSTDCPSGPAEILDGGAYGKLVPVGDDAALAEAILATLDAPPDRSRLRLRAAEFSEDDKINQYLQVLQAAASSSSRHYGRHHQR